MVEAGLVRHAARSVVRNDDRYDLAVGCITFVEGDDDGVVPGLPYRRRSDLGNYITNKLVALRDQPTLLDRTRPVRVHAPGRGAMHVMALVGDDVAEVGNVTRRKVNRQLLKREHLRELGRRLKVGKVHDAVVLRCVLSVGIRNAEALVWIAIATITRVGHVLEVTPPGLTRPLELRHQVGCVYSVPREPVWVVAGDTEEVAAEHGDVIRLARIRDARVICSEPVV